jgi:hypothetical protein
MGSNVLRRSERLWETARRRDPVVNLAVSVLRVALEDLRRGEPQAVSWFTGESRGLEFWAEVLDIDVEILRARALEDVARSSGGAHQQQHRRKRAVRPGSHATASVETEAPRGISSA